MLRKIVCYSAIISTLLATSGCGSKSASFSLMQEAEGFSQNTYDYVTKVDILWVVDASGTMENHQNNLAANFGSFIDTFTEKNIDFHMAVTSVDAWLRERNYNHPVCGNSNPNPSLSPLTPYLSSADCKSTVAKYGELTWFRDGDIYGSETGNAGVRSGEFLITSQMPDAQVKSLFAQNVRVGTRGDGTRESAFQSLRAVLRRNELGTVGYNGETHTVLNQFRRPDAFLAVIIVSDEEDQGRRFDNTSYSSTADYVSAFTTFLEGYTGSTVADKRFSVSSITIEDINNCQYGLHAQATQGDRYVAIAQAANGIVGNICSANFSNDLTLIADKVVTLVSRFEISREPIVSTIQVSVNGAVVPNDATNGWTYTNEGGKHYINFNGTAVPPQGAKIAINYDPVGVK